MSDRIYKSSTQKLITGVCGGLAEYFGVDPVLVRAAFVVVTLLWGAGLLVYIALAFIIPSRQTAGATPAETIQRNIDDLSHEAQQRAKEMADAVKAGGERRRNTLAIILIGVGLVLLAGQGMTVFFVWWFVIAPLLLIGLGIAVLMGIFHPPVR